MPQLIDVAKIFDRVGNVWQYGLAVCVQSTKIRAHFIIFTENKLKVKQ